MIPARNKIPYVNLGEQYRREKKDLLPLIDKIFSSGNYILGNEVLKLEENIIKVMKLLLNLIVS